MRSVIKEVEAEFGEPFWQVVEGFAKDGHSVQSVAELLGYASATPFRRLLQRHGVAIKFAHGQESVFQLEARQHRRGRCTPAQMEATKLASAANHTYKQLIHDGKVDTLAGHARRLGMSESTARKRYRRNPDPAYVFARCSHLINPPKGKGWQANESNYIQPARSRITLREPTMKRV